MRGIENRLQIRLLGPFSHDDRNRDGLPKKAQALLAYLAMNRGRTIPRDQLADLLWSASGPEQGRHSLRQSLAAVRRAIGADARDLIATVGNDVLLAESNAVDVDAHRFETLAQSTAPADLAAASELYRGEFLADFDVPSEPFMAWVRVERTRLEATACGLLGRLATALSDAGDHDAAIATAKRLIALDPLREDGHRLLMQLYASVGRRAEAVRQFAICSDSLRRELDVAPDAKTTALARAILAEAPAQGAANSGTAELVPEAARAEAEIAEAVVPAPGPASDEAGEAAATNEPMEAGAAGRGENLAAPTAVARDAAAFAADRGASQAGPAGTRPEEAPERRWNSQRLVRALATLSVAAIFVTAAGAGIWHFSLLRFDGDWSVQLICPPENTAEGYSYHFPAQVKDGVLHGERGTAGTPGWYTIDGPIRADGTATLNARGLINDPARTSNRLKTGTPYSYTIEARFSGAHASGKRVELRVCTVGFTKT
jgi:DNA-binding SARP family transcriptional activator